MRTGKHNLLILAATYLFASTTYAVAPGLYLGIMTGPATNNAKPTTAKTTSGTPPVTPVTPKSQQIGSRVYLGYKANQYAAAEFGFTYFSTIVYDNKGVQTCSGTQAHVRDMDVVGKLSYPVYGFEPYGKAGAAAVFTSTSGGLNSGPSTCGKTKYANQIKPTFSIGAGYDLSQNWVMDISANVLMAPGSISRMTYFAIGISYHFVDTYCGQFLCD